MQEKIPPDVPGGDDEVPVLPSVNPAVPDHATPKTSAPFPIVAIAASAGGIEAFGEMLGCLPANTGMAFVLIQHLSPDHESVLAAIFARKTPMTVTQAREGEAVEPNHVYVIPPGATMVLAKGALRLSPRVEPRGAARPADQFMRSLAQEHGHKSIGVVLSGTGSDGTLGIEEVKAAGGITFVQDGTAEHDGMPRSALQGGSVDYVLPPGEIALELARIASHPYVAPMETPATLLGDLDMQRVLQALHGDKGVDFSQYKRNTLYRRITRRMLLHRMESAAEYLARLDEDPKEVEALYRDVLINVTSFFRDPESYEALKATVFPLLTADRPRQDPIRIWALACSTGEEAYSLAMAFTEYLEESGRRATLQIFATDVNGAGIEKARAGIYPKGIAQDVSPERLRRFFVIVDGCYRICKPIRDMCVFARQNVLADPPFSRIDLVACRNLLIYMEPALQQRLIPLVHYALRGKGFLWLGGCETIGTYRDFFELLDARAKIYLKKHGAGAQVALPSSGARWIGHTGVAPVPPPEPAIADAQREADRLLLIRYAPPGVVINEDLEILQFRGDTSPFLRPPPGKASHNLIKMLREGLMVAVRGAVSRARRDQLPAREEGLKVRSNGGWRAVDVAVLPLKPAAAGSGTLVVLFEEPAHSVEARVRLLEAEDRPDREAGPGDADSTKEIARLKQELSATRDYLQSVIEQQETANEELQSANEEVQSSNEELQSINEELETSKEEIQSSNEELATVNDELQNRNLEISQSNNDLMNLLASVQMAIVMLGPDLRIRRFTPAAEKLLKLIPADVGRPIADIKLNLDFDELEAVVVEVIESMANREREVRDRNGHWYLLRVRPYRTLENRIDGAVILLIDIDGLKQAQSAAGESESRFEVLADNAPVPIWMRDMDGARFVNRAFEEFFGARSGHARAADPERFVHPADRAAYLTVYENARKARKPFQARMRMRRADGQYRWVNATGAPRFGADGSLVGFVGCAFDLSDIDEVTLPPTVASRRVLVVDDNDDSAQSLAMLLTAEGHEVHTANTGAEALEVAATFTPQVVLLDITLPDMDGYEVARRLRASPAGRAALLLAVTGYGSEEDVRKSRDAGFDRHLTKPLDPNELSRIVMASRP